MGLARTAKKGDHIKNNSSKKGKRSTKPTVTKQSTTANMKHDNIDVKTLEDADKLVEHIKNNVVTLLLIYADWCGHCGTFKEEIWKKLATLKGRKVPIAQVNESVFSKIPSLSGIKIDGYPTNVLIGNDMKPATFKDDESGESTNAMPNTRDLASMTRLVNADPNQLMADTNMTAGEDTPASVTPSAKTAAKLNDVGDSVMNDIENGTPINTSGASISASNPPDVEDDLISSQIVTQEASNVPKATVGGSLYASLLEAVGAVAPAVILTAAAMRTRRVKSRRKTSKKVKRR